MLFMQLLGKPGSNAENKFAAWKDIAHRRDAGRKRETWRRELFSQPEMPVKCGKSEKY